MSRRLLKCCSSVWVYLCASRTAGVGAHEYPVSNTYTQLYARLCVRVYVCIRRVRTYLVASLSKCVVIGWHYSYINVLVIAILDYFHYGENT